MCNSRNTKKRRRLLRGFGARRKTIARWGAATVEMAIVAPFVFFLIFSSIEFARMMMVRQSLTNAARESARHASLITTQVYSDAEVVLRDQLVGVVKNHDDESIVRIETTPAFTSSPPSGTRITTTVEVDCSDISWLPPIFFSGAKITGASAMFRE